MGRLYLSKFNSPKSNLLIETNAIAIVNNILENRTVPFENELVPLSGRIVICVVSQVYVTLSSQEDLDQLIELINSNTPSRHAFNIRLFNEPPPVPTSDGVFIQSPDLEFPLVVCAPY